jgi:signal transduction histidine kinase
VEFRTGRLGAAIALYRRAAQSVESSVAGPALAGLGRALRKSGRPAEALEAYGALAALGATPVFGLPAELVAREARCSVFAEIGRRDELAAEATEMATALWDRRYVLEQSVWAFHLDEAIRFGAADARSPDRRDALVLARAAGWAFEICQRADAGNRLRRALSIDGEPALVVCRAGEGVPARAIVAGSRYVRALAGEKILDEALEGMVGGRPTLRMALVDGERHLVAGALDRSRPSAVQTPDATALPWTIYVSDANDGTATLLGGRRRFLLAAFAVLGLALGTGSFFIVRSLRRERAAAALQSDFVAAVSHEFRTPLTSIRQLSELLATGRLVGEDRRGQAYAILSEEGRRLDRLVESLLDFGRLQAGTHAYQPERISAAELAERAVAEFRGSPRTDGYRFEVLHECDATVRVDPASLALALRNLLDNAVKYSGDSRRIRVSTGWDRGFATISVTDEGPGIPPAEQRAVFGAFVRGSGARAAGVRGTGLGLALAERIVAAHGGDIRVASESGCGSTFTIVLPAEGSP